MSDLVSQRLTEAEGVIERGLGTFVEVGAALMSIRDERLYRVEYGTFEDYCRERWGFSRSRTYQMIDAASVVQAVSTIVDTPIPATESQARELTGLAPDVAAEVMQVAAATGKVTAATIRETRTTIVDTDTGEILDGPTRAGRAAADAVMNVVQGDAGYRQANLMRDVNRALSIRPPFEIDPVDASVLPFTDADVRAWDRNRNDVNEWLDKFMRARTGLRVINGGQ
jgi:hypothetical protein